MKNSTRIILNTAAQYIRTILHILLSFISIRLVLNALGADDYGIYTLIAGVTAMLSFVTQALVTTTQRFMSYYQGQNEPQKMKLFFTNSLLLHIFIGIIFSCVLFLITPLLFNGFLNVSIARIHAAKIVYYIVIAILFVTFCTAPYRALLVSHENIIYISIIDVLDGILKVVLVLILQYVSHDKLIIYGLIMLSIHFFNFFTMSIYASRKYEECVLPNFNHFNIRFFKDLFSFAIWTIYGTGCVVIRTQGLAIVVNKFFSTVANAAYGIGLQVSGAVSTISVALLNAMRPQIVKAEGGGLHEKALMLATSLCRYSLILLSAFCIPCIYEMPSLLILWLKDVPEYTVLFARMALIASLADTLTLGLNTYCEAIGRIKKYNLIIFSLKLLTLPIAILLLTIKVEPIVIAITYIGMEILTSIIRLPFLKQLGNLKIFTFIKDVIGRTIIPILSSIFVCHIITNRFDFEFRFLLTFSASILLFCTSIIFCGLTNQEKTLLKKLLKK